MCRAAACCYACVRTDEADVDVVIGDIRVDLVGRAQRQKRAEHLRIDNLARQRETCGSTDLVRFGNAEIEAPVGVVSSIVYRPRKTAQRYRYR